MPSRDDEILRHLLQVSHSGLMIIDQSGKVLLCNKAAHQLLGWKKQKTRYLFAEDQGTLLDIHKQETPLGYNPIQKALDTQKTLRNIQFTWRKKSGKERQFSLNIEPIIKKDVLHGALVSLQDISVRVGEERWREHLIRVAGHELRNPLASIMALAETIELLNEPEDEDRRLEFTNKIKHKVRSTSRLLNDFIDATRLSSGILQYRNQVQDLDELVKRIAEDYQLSSSAHWIAVKGETNAKVKVDVVRLTQVLENLLSNAIKNSPTGSGIVIQLGTKNNKATVEVIDQGIGIPKKEIKNVFRMYYRVQNGQYQPRGMGLGLYLVQRILEHYRSKIVIKSEEGKGTSVRFSLPINK